MFILARTFLKTHNICCYYRDNIFFLLLCPSRDYCFFWDNMIKYTEHIISEPEDSKSFFFYLTMIQQEHGKEKYTQHLSGIFMNTTGASYILTVIYKNTHIFYNAITIHIKEYDILNK